MATVVSFAANNESDGVALRRWVANVQQCYFDGRHMLDHLIALQASGGDAAIAAAVGAADAAAGLAIFNAVNQTNGYMLNAHDASAPLDQMRPV